MDAPDLAVAAHREALRGLARINRISRGHAMIWRELRGLARNRPNDELRVLDVACGSGDAAVRLARRAAREGVGIRMDGMDRSITAVDFANRRAKDASVSCRFFQADALHDAWPPGYDVICCSLFLHHLSEGEARHLLAKMAGQAGKMVIVNDLVRGRFNYLLARFGTALLSRSPIVRYDGPASVASAFTRPELRALAEAAGLRGAKLARCWPARMLMTWTRT